ncbi:MAG: 4a-hydroxytetrahydrobiopterin dehydratase [Betaproteobacteria bacterium]|nr:4a-hydroxytetrahydrobiopterin dehydratase [Rhodocyclaceae bacterium]MCA3134906.1 4a-hydroxytetrahydrobiopterin dehydratase [Rhodocyclaceae bacterium]MCA3141347.1 4a-hydroxytetrahydrobiopterin dehydratase [Rhodocyclaceae bacterium]MCA3147373.1 4a-hydroxytetrahydrobiopterin dehydratase [Rhodocyclaceae bacterium]MCE2899089.1 4a-hydroxytetrahydrobiopterin dehydratase [Betaproteobacteria bacterium]
MNKIAEGLVRKKCAPCEGGVAPLEPANVQALLKGLPGWTLDSGRITKTWDFRNYFDSTAFVNATAWISHREDHHPDIELTYNKVKVSYWTHAIGGLSENDFICAAKIDALFAL